MVNASWIKSVRLSMFIRIEIHEICLNLCSLDATTDVFVSQFQTIFHGTPYAFTELG